MTQIKICGITKENEVPYLVKYGADYIGMVLFYPKSRRNISIERAKQLIAQVRVRSHTLKTVAVVVSPDEKQIRKIKAAGFDLLQVHGKCSPTLLNELQLPYFLAVNIADKDSLLQLDDLDIGSSKLAGLVFDGKKPGEGKRFDWSVLEHFDRQQTKIMLAGGLNPENIGEAVTMIHPDIVDVSSGVERRMGNLIEKDPVKIRDFINRVREVDRKGQPS